MATTQSTTSPDQAVQELARLAKQLEQLPLFYDFSHAEITQVAALVTEISFLPKQVVFRAGEVGDHVYIVVSGLVRLASHDLDQAGPEDFIVRSRNLFGEDCVFDESPRGLTAVALMRTHCLAISRQGLQTLEAKFPRTALKLVRKLARNTSMRLRQAIGGRVVGADSHLVPLPSAIPLSKPLPQGRLTRMLAAILGNRESRDAV